MNRQVRDKLDDDHLVRQFRSFFDEVTKAQARAIEMRETDPAAAASGMNKRLLDIIELQTLESTREGSRFELESMADARYLKAALADELLFGRLANGGEVNIDVDATGAIQLRFEEALEPA